MEIPNLSPKQENSITTNKASKIPLIVIISAISIASGFWLSRFFPLQNSQNLSSNSSSKEAVSIENIQDTSDLTPGIIYGNSSKNFKDSAVGTVEKGGVNGEGTHSLIREGGDSQKASLTSSAVDLDLFVGKKVEIKGETNTSNKSAWLLDVGSIKILE